MTTTQKTYSLTSKPQLVDLNGDATNFDLSFSATSTKGQNFFAVVLDQSTLDTGEEPQYRLTEGGTISANVVSESGVTEDYYLMLKSDKEPCEVLVTITITSQNTLPPRSEQTSSNLHSKKEQMSEPPQRDMPPKEKKKGGMSKFMIFALVIGVVAIGGAIFYFKVIKKKNNPDVPTLEMPSNTFLPGFSPSSHSLPSPTPSLTSQVTSSINQSLLDKLNKFVIPSAKK